MIGDRLRQERERLGLTQDEFSAAAGSKRRTLVDWEKGVSSPTAVQLAALRTAGVDVTYVITGEHQGHGIGEQAVHQAVLDAVDLLSLDKKVDARQLAKAVVKLCARQSASTASPPHQAQQSFEGGYQVFHQAPTGDVAARDIIKDKARKGKE